MRGVAAGALLLLAGLLAMHAGEEAPAKGVSESDGRAGSVYIHFTRGSSAILGPVYRDLVRELRGPVYVACPEAEDWKSFEAAVGSDERFRPILTHRPTSSWAKDRFIPVRADGRLRLLVPERPPATPMGHADWLVAWDLARATGASVRTLPIDFDGGDVWMTDEIAFAGRLLIEKNPEFSETQIRRLLEAELGLRVVFVDGAPHHVGMFLTPIGGSTVMVADPDLVPQGDRSAPWLANLRELPARLESEGFKVIRVPFAATDQERVYITYNNVLLDGSTVFMPVYDRPEMDRAARTIWESRGFTVRPIHASELYVHRGVVHCLVSVLSRN
jgi:hypothetical protein